MIRVFSTEYNMGVSLMSFVLSGDPPFVFLWRILLLCFLANKVMMMMMV